MDVELRKGSVSKGEEFEEGVVPDPPGLEGWRMTGSALQRWELHGHSSFITRGGVWGGVVSRLDLIGGVADLLGGSKSMAGVAF